MKNELKSGILSVDKSPDRRPTHISADDNWRATIGRSSANDRPMICGSFKYDIGRLIGRPSSADCQNPKTGGQWKINYNKVVIIYFLSADEKRAKIWHFIGRSLAGLM